MFPIPERRSSLDQALRLRAPTAALFVLAAACGPEQAIVRDVTTSPTGDVRADAAAADGAQANDANDASAAATADLGTATTISDAPQAPDAALPLPPVADAGIEVSPGSPPSLDAALVDAAAAPRDAAADRPRERLEVDVSFAAQETDLTEEGELDWIHWGLGSADEPNRKRDVTRPIRWAVIGERGLGTYDDRPVTFSWSDGTPTTTARTRQGITTGGAVGVGYRLRFDGPQPSGGRLRVYAGAWNARAELRVRIRNSDLGMETRSLDVRAPGRDRIFDIDFGALGDDESVIVEWVLTELHNVGGNVTLQAAALSGATAQSIE